MEDKLREAVERELVNEETKSKNVGNYNFFGFINDDRELITNNNFVYDENNKAKGINLPIGWVHFGLVYVIRTSSDIQLVEDHQRNFKLASLRELIEKKENMETWSQCIVDYLTERVTPFFID